MKTKCWLVLAFAFFLARPDCRAYAIYLTTENPVIAGEETAKGYENSWRVFSFSTGVSNTSVAGQPPSPPNFQDVAIAKFLDKASVLVLLNTAQGAPIGKVNIFLVRETAPIFVAYKIVLENVTISSISQSAGDPVSEQTYSSEIG
jgi:type VI protein secretion system component Hcp